jgi:polygalacturonase
MELSTKDIALKYPLNVALDIQNLIDKIDENKGGTLIFSKGLYKLSTIRLCSNLTIILEAGANIILNDDLESFKKSDTKLNILTDYTYKNCDYNGLPQMFFIYAKDIENLTIKGYGLIDGSEDIFYGKISKWHIDGFFYPRIPLCYFENVKNLNLSDFSIKRSAFWTIHIVGCNNVNIKNLTIDNNLRLANCDGLDIDSSKNVYIDSCFIAGADDSIVIKTTEYASKKYGESKDIFVKNSKLCSTSAAIKLGSESCDNFSNIHFEDIEIFNSNRGISIQQRDKGNISDIYFKNINISTRLFSPLYWWGKGEAISITSLNRVNKNKLGTIKNIYFENIKANCENGIVLYSKDKIIKDIYFNNINLTLEKKTDYKPLIDTRPGESSDILDLGLYYIYMFNFICNFSNMVYTSKKKIKEKFYLKNSTMKEE